MTDDIAALVERLTSHMGKQDVAVLLDDCRQAAATITALQARVGELEAERNKQDAERLFVIEIPNINHAIQTAIEKGIIILDSDGYMVAARATLGDAT